MKPHSGSPDPDRLARFIGYLTLLRKRDQLTAIMRIFSPVSTWEKANRARRNLLDPLAATLSTGGQPRPIGVVRLSR
jgi:hypothetical protein